MFTEKNLSAKTFEQKNLDDGDGCRSKLEKYYGVNINNTIFCFSKIPIQSPKFDNSIVFFSKRNSLYNFSLLRKKEIFVTHADPLDVESFLIEKYILGDDCVKNLKYQLLYRVKNVLGITKSQNVYSEDQFYFTIDYLQYAILPFLCCFFKYSDSIYYLIDIIGDAHDDDYYNFLNFVIDDCAILITDILDHITQVTKDILSCFTRYIDENGSAFDKVNTLFTSMYTKSIFYNGENLTIVCNPVLIGEFYKNFFTIRHVKDTKKIEILGKLSIETTILCFLQFCRNFEPSNKTNFCFEKFMNKQVNFVKRGDLTCGSSDFKNCNVNDLVFKNFIRSGGVIEEGEIFEMESFCDKDHYNDEINAIRYCF